MKIPKLLAAILTSAVVLCGCGGGGPYEGQYYVESGGGEWHVSIEGDSKITGVLVTGNSLLSYVGKTKSVNKVDENTFEIKATATSQLKSPTMGDMITENIPVVCRWHKGQNGEPDNIDYVYGEKEERRVHLKRAKADK